MYVPDRKITGITNSDVVHYVENNDVYNSKLLRLLNQLPAVGTYRIKRYEYRIDLISQDMYGKDVADLIMIYNNVKISDLKIGFELKKFSLSDLDTLILNLDGIR